ncbi:MAG: TIGR00730 family Rossman fold protein [Verrucomicrobiota bacterium]
MSDNLTPPKAYNNLAFLNSQDARKIRVLCEMSEPEQRFRELKIEDTIVFFGSARSRPSKQAEADLETARAAVADPENPTPEERRALYRAESTHRLAPYHDAAVELARRMTAWSLGLENGNRRFLVCTGGGPGMMEAANEGAAAAGGKSLGLGISLPFEQGLNPHVTPELAFEFHYFFVRKYWFAYWAKALIVFPGGFGTMDELFELLTLVQTRKIEKAMPILLYGSAFWTSILNFEEFVKWGVVAPEDLDRFKIVDSVEEAEQFLVDELSRHYL